MKWYVFFPENMEYNTSCRVAFAQYKEVAHVEAVTNVELLLPIFGQRSLAIGDIVQSELDCFKKVCQIYTPTGFQTVSNMWIRFRDKIWQVSQNQLQLSDKIMEPEVLPDLDQLYKESKLKQSTKY